ncbi:MAG: peptidoglycan-binding domain-containing protein, partial [Cyanobacteria bacterium J06642_11]
EIAVKTFQSRMFLKPDGVVDVWTWQALCSNAPVGMPTLQQGCHGPAVEAIQDLLAIDLYYTGDVDGYFGPHTRAAIKRFQSESQLSPTGIVDTTTWQALSEI